MNQPIAKYSDIFKSGEWEGLDKFTDAILYIDDGTQFPIHRVKLYKRSKFIDELLNSASSEIINISEIDGKTMEQILVFIYTGQAALNQENVWALMTASDYLQMDDLVRECKSFSVRNLNVGNCMSATATAFKAEILSLFQECLRFTTVHFEKIVGDRTTDLEQVPLEILNMLLRSDSLNVSTERTVWMAIARWVTSDTENRLSSVPQLLASIRLRNQVLEQDLVREILAHDIVRKNPFGLQYAMTAMYFEYGSWHFLRQEVYHILKQLGLPQRSSRLPRCLYFVTRHKPVSHITPNDLGSELLLTVDDRLDWFRQVGDVPFFVKVALVLGNTLYLFDTLENTCMRYDTVKETWKQMKQLSDERCNYSVVTLGGCIYVVGGLFINGEYQATTPSIECYHPDGNFWHPMRPRKNMIVCDAVVYNDKILVIGYTLEGTMICQVYDAERDLWTTMSPPAVLRTGFTAVVFGSSVMVAGGKNDSGYLNSVEHYNSQSETWDRLPDLPFAYITPKAVVVEDKLVVFDNTHLDTRFCPISPPVIWNMDNRAWEVIDTSSPFHGIKRYTFCKIEDRVLVEILIQKNRSPNVKGYRKDVFVQSDTHS